MSNSVCGVVNIKQLLKVNSIIPNNIFRKASYIKRNTRPKQKDCLVCISVNTLTYKHARVYRMNLQVFYGNCEETIFYRAKDSHWKPMITISVLLVEQSI